MHVQVQSLNALLILILVPLFKGVVYPAVTALGYRLTPLRCMSAGMVCTGLSFVIIAAIQVLPLPRPCTRALCSCASSQGMAAGIV